MSGKRLKESFALLLSTPSSLTIEGARLAHADSRTTLRDSRMLQIRPLG